MNIGVRYANESPWHSKYGQWAQFNPLASDPLIAGDMGQITHPGGNMNDRHNFNFEPRLGLAWHPSNKLVIRAGFALMHVDLGLAPSELQEYSIAASLSQRLSIPNSSPMALSPIRAAPAPRLPASPVRSKPARAVAPPISIPICTNLM